MERASFTFAVDLYFLYCCFAFGVINNASSE